MRTHISAFVVALRVPETESHETTKSARAERCCGCKKGNREKRHPELVGWNVGRCVVGYLVRDVRDVQMQLPDTVSARLLSSLNAAVLADKRQGWHSAGNAR